MDFIKSLPILSTSFNKTCNHDFVGPSSSLALYPGSVRGASSCSQPANDCWSSRRYEQFAHSNRSNSKSTHGEIGYRRIQKISVNHIEQFWDWPCRASSQSWDIIDFNYSRSDMKNHGHQWHKCTTYLLQILHCKGVARITVGHTGARLCHHICIDRLIAKDRNHCKGNPWLIGRLGWWVIARFVSFHVVSSEETPAILLNISILGPCPNLSVPSNPFFVVSSQCLPRNRNSKLHVRCWHHHVWWKHGTSGVAPTAARRLAPGSSLATSCPPRHPWYQTAATKRSLKPLKSKETAALSS